MTILFQALVLALVVLSFVLVVGVPVVLATPGEWYTHCQYGEFTAAVSSPGCGVVTLCTAGRGFYGGWDVCAIL